MTLSKHGANKPGKEVGKWRLGIDREHLFEYLINCRLEDNGVFRLRNIYLCKLANYGIRQRYVPVERRNNKSSMSRRVTSRPHPCPVPIPYIAEHHYLDPFVLQYYHFNR